MREVGRLINLVFGWAFRRNVRREVGRKGKGGERRGEEEMGEESSLSMTQPS